MGKQAEIERMRQKVSVVYLFPVVEFDTYIGDHQYEGLLRNKEKDLETSFKQLQDLDEKQEKERQLLLDDTICLYQYAWHLNSML